MQMALISQAYHSDRGQSRVEIDTLSLYDDGWAILPHRRAYYRFGHRITGLVLPQCRR